MASDADNVQRNFDKFVESMYQYVKEPIKDFASIKPQLLDILKTHRPVRTVDYQYGISKSLKGKSQLIIHEFNQRSMVREYFKTGNDNWHCCECNRIGASKNDNGIADVLVLHGIVFVKLEHDCAGREISFVQKVQKLYKEKKVEEADALQKSVLGSEDLHIASSKQKSAARRHGTETSSKMSEDIIAEVRLRFSQLKDNGEFSRAGENSNERQEKLSPKEAFAKIIENLEEYTNETKETVLAKKSKILTILKTHRPMKIIDYQYGLMANLRENRRSIVFEWGDRRRVREYSKRKGENFKNLWACLECYRLNNRRGKNVAYSYLVMVSGVAFVLINHDIKCEPRDYNLVMIYQKFLEEGNTKKAWAMAQKISFAYGQSLSNIINAISAPSMKNETFIDQEEEVNEKNSKTYTKLKRKISSDSGDEKPPVHKKSKLNKSDLNDTVTQAEMDKGPLDSDVVTSMYHFEKPTTSKLEEICGKLNIRYRTKVVKLWDKIIFEQIDTVSMPSSNMQTHYFETDNFYQILSIFFTGKSKQHEEIKSTIIDAFREKLVSSGEMTTKKFNKKYLDTVTDEHFAFITKFLKCRILIFNGENGIRKYGKWKSISSSRLTLVVAFKGGYYSIVLSL